MADIRETLLEKEPIYHGKYLSAERHTILLPDGKKATREIIIPPDAAAVLPIDEKGNVYLVRQYRTAIAQTTLEIPAGILDPDEKPLDTAGRECAEEIGMAPKRLDFMFRYYHSVGFSTGQIAVFLGRELVSQNDHHPDAGEFLEVVVLPFDTLYQKAIAGEIVDSKTLLAVLWYRQHYS